jgi:hypothetical protein
MPVADRQAGEIDHGPGRNVENAARIVSADHEAARTRADDVQAFADH